MDLTDPKTQAEILGTDVLMGLVFIHYVIYDKETQETYVTRIKPKEDEIDFESGTKVIIGEIHLSENKGLSIVNDERGQYGFTEDVEIPVDISYKDFCDLVLQGCADKVGVKINEEPEEPEEGETRWYLVKGEGLEKE